MSLLGIDVGTTGCKTSAFSEDGALLAGAYREYPTLHPQPGQAELDSAQVWGCVKETIAAVAAETRSDPITALCVSSMGEAMTPVSNDRKILGNSILSSDIRGGEFVEALLSELSQEEFYRINPNILASNYSMPKLCWIRENLPDLWQRTDKFLLWGDLVMFLLGCEAVTSASHANRTLLFDIHQQTWSEQLLNLSGIDEQMLPRPCLSGALAGKVSDAAAAELGLPRDVTVVVGGHDQCCNALGAGIHTAGKAVCGIGTVECITPVYDHIPEPDKMLARGLNVEHHILPGLYVSFIYNQAGSLVKWFRNTFAAAEARQSGADGNVYDRLAREMPEAPTRLFTLPYFEMTGTPEFVADASGVIAGLRMSTTRGEILKSIMESVTFYFAGSIDALREMGIDTSEFVATGGGANSDPWLQIKADICGVPFVRPRIIECTVLGAAMLAGIATECFAGPAEAVERFVVRDRVFEPDAERHAVYQERLEKYRRLFPLLRDFLRDT